MKTKRLFYLDFIRVVSILFIVIFHFNYAMVIHSITGKVVLISTYKNVNLGQAGVSMFFIISGAALMHTYENYICLFYYYKKRFLSIFPVYWTTYLIAFLYLFGTNKNLNPFTRWTLLLTALGFDGYTLYAIPNFYIIGEWFLGCLIIYYLIFPFLRHTVIKYPKIIAILSTLIYFIIVITYHFKMPIERNIFTRLPEFLLGMYFVRYLKKFNHFYLVSSAIIIIIMLSVNFNINVMYKYTIVGFTSFIIFWYIGQSIKSEKVKKIIFDASKYVFVLYLVHHLIIHQILAKFEGRTLSDLESLTLFVFVLAIIIAISVGLNKMYGSVVKHYKNLLIDKI